jgi:hypothetical protein
MSGFPIDYTESIHDLSYRLSKFLLRQGAAIVLLHQLACLADGGSSSWIMRLDHRREPHGIDGIVDSSQPNRWYKAGGSYPIRYEMKDESKSLIFKGVVVDILCALSEPYPEMPSNDLDNMPREFIDRMEQWDHRTLHWAYGQPLLAKPPKLLLKEYRMTTTGGGPSILGMKKVSDRDITVFKEYQERLADGRPIFPWKPFGLARVSIKIVSLMTSFCRKKSVGVTGKSRLCLVPDGACEGDIVVVLRGFPAPFLVRQSGDGFRLLGGTYLHGVMNGEALPMFDEQERDIVLY